MKILITGAKGFVGKNMVASLEAVRDGKDRVHKIRGLENPGDLVLYTYDIDSTQEDLENYCKAGRRRAVPEIQPGKRSKGSHLPFP